MKLIELLKEDTMSVHSIWYNPETTGSVAIDRFAYHDRLIHNNPEFFPNKPENPGKALEQGYLRGSYTDKNRRLTIDAKDTAHVAEFIKWIRQNYGKINRVHIFVPQNASSLTGDEIDDVLMTGKLRVPIGEALNTSSSYNIWYNPQTNEALMKPMVQSTHITLIKNNLEWFGISHKDVHEVIKQWGGMDTSDYYKMAFDNGYIRGYYSEGTAGIEALELDNIPKFIKWMKDSFKKIYDLDIDLIRDSEGSLGLSGDDIDRVLMTGKLPMHLWGESLNESYDVNLDAITDQILTTSRFSNHGSSLGEFIYHYPDSYKPWWDESLPELQVLRSPEFKEGFKRWMKDRYRYVVKQLKQDIKGFPLEIARAMTVPLGARPRPGDAVGLFWAVHSSHYEVMAYQGKGGEEIFMAASVGAGDINWKETIRSRMDYMHGDGEGEIQLKPGRVINVHTGDIEPGQYVTKNLGESRRRVARSVDNIFESILLEVPKYFGKEEPGTTRHDFLQATVYNREKNKVLLDPDRISYMGSIGKLYIYHLAPSGIGFHAETAYVYASLQPDLIDTIMNDPNDTHDLVLTIMGEDKGKYFSIELVEGREEYSGHDVAATVYEWLILNFKPLVSDSELSYGGQHIWKQLAQNRNVKVFATVPEKQYHYAPPGVETNKFYPVWVEDGELAADIPVDFASVRFLGIPSYMAESFMKNFTDKIFEAHTYKNYTIWWDANSDDRLIEPWGTMHHLDFIEEEPERFGLKDISGWDGQNLIRQAKKNGWVRANYTARDKGLYIESYYPAIIPEFIQWAQKQFRRIDNAVVELPNNSFRLSGNQIDQILMTGKLTEAINILSIWYDPETNNAMFDEGYAMHSIILQDHSKFFTRMEVRPDAPYDNTVEALSSDYIRGVYMRDKGHLSVQTTKPDYVPEFMKWARERFRKLNSVDVDYFRSADSGLYDISLTSDQVDRTLMTGKLTEEINFTLHSIWYDPESNTAVYGDGYAIHNILLRQQAAFFKRMKVEPGATYKTTVEALAADYVRGIYDSEDGHLSIHVKNPDHVPAFMKWAKEKYRKLNEVEIDFFKSPRDMRLSADQIDRTLMTGRLTENERSESRLGLVNFLRETYEYNEIRDALQNSSAIWYNISTKQVHPEYEWTDSGSTHAQAAIDDFNIPALQGYKKRGPDDPFVLHAALEQGWIRIVAYEDETFKIIMQGLNEQAAKTAWSHFKPYAPEDTQFTLVGYDDGYEEKLTESIDKIFEDVVGMQAIWYDANTGNAIMEPWTYKTTHLSLIQQNPNFFDGEEGVKQAWKNFNTMSQRLKHYFQQGYVRGAYSDKRKFLSVQAKEEDGAAGLIKWVSQKIRKIDTIVVDTDYAEYKLSGNDIDDVIMTGTIPKNKALYVMESLTELQIKETTGIGTAAQYLVQDWYNMEKPPGIDVSLTARKSNLVEISGINSDEVGQGHASTALQHILGLADRYKVTLYLEPHPMEPDNEEFLDYDQLVAWYKRAGFEYDEQMFGMYRKPAMGESLNEGSANNKTIWWDSQSDDYIIKPWGIEHATIVRHDTDRFRLDKELIPVYTDIAGSMDIVQMALDQGWVRSHYSDVRKSLYIETKHPQVVPTFIKWAKQLFKRINTVDLEVGETGHLYRENEIDQILMTGKLPRYVSESLNESTQWPERISSTDLIDLVSEWSSDDIWEWDLVERIEAYNVYVLKEVPIDSIESYWHTEDTTVEEYMQRYQAGERPPPIVMQELGNVIMDGSHRHEALKRLGVPKILAYVGKNEYSKGIFEIREIPSSSSIEFTCGACMYFAYVLNRKFGWPMAGTFMESPIDPEKGMPGEVSDFADYDTEKVMFGHVWVQATPDIAVDIDGAKSTNKMKEQWGNYPYTHVTSITPEWMGNFFQTNYPNQQARRAVWKRALKAAELLRTHLKGEGLTEAAQNNIAIWYDPQTAQTVSGPWVNGHDSLIAQEPHFFQRIDDQLTDAEFAGEWVTETAVRNGFARVVWGPNQRAVDVETNNVAVVPEILKWIKQTFGRINIVYITDEQQLESGRLEGENIDQVLMTGKYPLNKRPKRTITGAPYPQNEHREFTFAQKIPKVGLVGFLKTLKEDSGDYDDYDPWANEEEEWIEIGFMNAQNGQQIRHRTSDFDLPPHSSLIVKQPATFGLDQQYLARVLGKDSWEELIAVYTKDAHGAPNEIAMRAINNELEHVMNGLYGLVYHNGWIRYGGDGKQLQMTSSAETLKLAWSTGAMQRLIRDLGSEKVQLSDAYSGVLRYETGSTFLKNFDLTSVNGKDELESYLS